MLNHRLLPAVFLIGTLLALAVWAPLWAMVPVLMAVSVLATHEHLRMLELRQIPAWRGLVLAGAALLPASGYAAGFGPADRVLPIVVFAALALALLIRQMVPAQDDLALPRLAGSFFGIGYVPVLSLFMGMLLHPGPGRDGRMLLLFLIVATKMCDMGAYFTGSAIGRTKLIPRISPKKTWEGCIGGLVWSTAASYAFHHFTGGVFGGCAFRLHDVLIIAPICGVLGILGDLAKSVMKRAAGVKDSGTLFAGMGGMLDVVDSLLFTSPFVFLYISVFVPSV